MGSKVFVTYKRKRLFSRSDHPLLNLNSDTCFESDNFKTSDSFAKQEGLIAKCTLQNNGTGFGICHAYSKDNTGENARQSENHNSGWCSQCSKKHDLKPKMLHSACSEQKKSPASDETQKFTPKQKCSPESDMEQIISHPNVIFDSAGLSSDEENIVSAHSKSSFVKSGSKYDNCKKILTAPQPSDACCDAESDPKSLKTSTLEETDKLNRDQYKTLHNNSGVKRKLGSGLITFCRRSKRNKTDNASKSETVTAKSCLMDLNEKVELSNSVAAYQEKDITEDIDKSRSLSAPPPAASTAVLADDPHHFLRREADDVPTAAAQKVCTDVEDSDHKNATTQRLSNQDVKTSRNFDCNIPPDGASRENQPIEKSEVVHDSLGSTFPLQQTENASSLRVFTDKGKRVLNSPPVSSHNSLKNTYFQFLPESKSDSILNLSNNSEKVNQPVPSIGFSLQPEQIVDGRASLHPSCEWPNFQPQPRESLLGLHLSSSDRMQSFSREKMMLDNILTRARAARGNRTSFLDKFEYPTTWLEEELDSLWIGVRRHGRGNWDAILGDRRLHFLPWKSPWDLAERWQVEQSRLLCSAPVSQRQYISPPDFSSEHNEVQLSLGQSHPLQKGFPSHLKNHVMKKDLRRNCLGLHATSDLGNESSSTAALMNGSLPHWLRTAAAVEIPRFTPPRKEPEPRKGGTVARSDFMERGKAQPKKNSIVIVSDVSSEETISDDRSRLS